MFSTFVVMWLSLMLQPCTLAATMSIESSAHAVADTQHDRAHSVSEQITGHDDCPLDSTSGDCCCGSTGLPKTLEESKRSLASKNNDDQSDSFADSLVTRRSPESFFSAKPLVNARPAALLPPGPAITIRNCVYLI